MALSGSTYVKTSTIGSFKDVPWINLTLTASISLTSITVTFVKPSGTGILNPATALEKGAAAEMASYELDISSDSGATWNMLTNATAATFPMTYTTAVPS